MVIKHFLQKNFIHFERLLAVFYSVVLFAFILSIFDIQFFHLPELASKIIFWTFLNIFNGGFSMIMAITYYLILLPIIVIGFVLYRFKYFITHLILLLLFVINLVGFFLFFQAIALF